MPYLDICLKQKIKCLHFLPFCLAFFSTLSSTRTVKVICLIFFNELVLKNLATNMDLLIYTYAPRPFSGWGGCVGAIRPSLYRAKCGEIFPQTPFYLLTNFLIYLKRRSRV